VAKKGRQWCKYSPEFKRDAADRMLAGEGVSALARELGLRHLRYQLVLDIIQAIVSLAQERA